MAGISRDEIEKRVLSCCIVYPELQSSLIIDLKKEDFNTLENQKIYNLLYRVNVEKETKLDLDNAYALCSELSLDKETFLTIMDIAQRVEIKDNYKLYLSSIKKSNVKLKLNQKLSHAKAMLESGDVQDIIKTLDVENLLDDVIPAKMFTDNDKLTNSIKELDEMYSKENKARMIQSGFKELDNIVTQIKHGEMCVISADPGTGKTNLCLNMFAYNFAKGRNCIFISLEMSTNEILYRLSNILSNVNGFFTRGGFESEAAIEKEANKYIDFINMMSSNKNWHIADRKEMKVGNIDEIVAYCKAVKKTKKWDNIDLIIIDYLQTITPKDYKMSEYEQTNYNLDKIQEYCNKDNIALMLISSLSKDGTIKGSAKVNFDADFYWHLAKDKDNEEIMRLKIVKNRHGSLGEIKFAKPKDTCRYTVAN